MLRGKTNIWTQALIILGVINIIIPIQELLQKGFSSIFSVSYFKQEIHYETPYDELKYKFLKHNYEDCDPIEFYKNKPSKNQEEISKKIFNKISW